MRLKTINLAGFKSFVDPTKIELPHDICVFVGPNGCGKSNVVDAVRLVIGESQASLIRGSALSDVIFNGTDSRPPTAHASVELIFDNADQQFGGKFAAYNDISLRREVFRDTQSRFFLNGNTCRRKDIQDLFLGSGFGARSYSIIEQGLIGRLVEARPEELRAHIEEVAGISKYRDRRRETERRILTTSTNLERVRDHNAELSRHIERLERQSREAKRFAELRDRQRLLEAKVVVTRITALDRLLEEKEGFSRAANLELQRHRTLLMSTRTKIDQLRVEEAGVVEKFSLIQGKVFEARAREGRLEEDLRNQNVRLVENQEEFDSLQSRLNKLAKDLNNDTRALAEVKRQIEVETPKRTEAQKAVNSANKRATNAQQTAQSIQNRWDELQARINELLQTKQYQDATLTHIESNLNEVKTQRTRVLSDLEVQADTQDSKSMKFELATLEKECSALRESSSVLEEAVDVIETDWKSAELSRDHLEEKLQSVRSSLAANEAVLESALRSGQSTSDSTWLATNNLDKNPKLVELIEVERGWEKAIETVLGDEIRAISVHDLDVLSRRLTEGIDEPFTLVKPLGSYTPRDKQLLINRVTSGQQFIAHRLAGVFEAQSLESAFDRQRSLKQSESVITKSGIWLGQNWIHVSSTQSDDKSLMQVKDAIKSLASESNQLEEDHRSIKLRLHELTESRLNLQEELRETQKVYEAKDSIRASLILQIQKVEMQRAEVQVRQSKLQSELQLIDARLNELHQNFENQRERTQLCNSEVEELTVLSAELNQERKQGMDDVRTAIERAQKAGDAYREFDVRLNTLVAERESLENSCSRLNTSAKELENRKLSLSDLRNELESGLATLEKDRQMASRTCRDVESQLHDVQLERDSLVFNIQENSSRAVLQERESQEQQQSCDKIREEIIRLTSEKKFLVSELDATGHALDSTQAQIDQNDTPDKLKDALERVSRRIERLGSVNLAAPQDLAVYTEERDLVLRQMDDLQNSQETLQDAIAKIDKETMSMFEDTLSRANEKLQEVFSKLFGGGSAQLVMTEEDPISAGISLQAQPPGKRNKNIGQLSGGEKALCAIAFIFAMFQLNPSPVCVLDEVDAPLDDANVLRFIELIQEMSHSVQFLIISHNRSTMQVAESLIGVTMQEAGVSRLVSVDLESTFESEVQ